MDPCYEQLRGRLRRRENLSCSSENHLLAKFELLLLPDRFIASGDGQLEVQCQLICRRVLYDCRGNSGAVCLRFLVFLWSYSGSAAQNTILQKIGTFRGDRQLRYLQYVILLVFVVLLPLFPVDILGQGACLLQVDLSFWHVAGRNLCRIQPHVVIPAACGSVGHALPAGSARAFAR